MPHHNNTDAFLPHRGEYARKNTRKIELGPCMDGRRPLRRRRWHTCGAVLFRGLKDFNGFHWVPTYHRSPRSNSPGLIRCPDCGGPLNHETVLEEEPTK